MHNIFIRRFRETWRSSSSKVPAGRLVGDMLVSSKVSQRTPLNITPCYLVKCNLVEIIRDWSKYTALWQQFLQKMSTSSGTQEKMTRPAWTPNPYFSLYPKKNTQGVHHRNLTYQKWPQRSPPFPNHHFGHPFAHFRGCNLVSGLNPPIWKICASQIGSFPQGSGGEHKKIFELPRLGNQ